MIELPPATTELIARTVTNVQRQRGESSPQLLEEILDHDERLERRMRLILERLAAAPDDELYLRAFEHTASAIDVLEAVERHGLKISAAALDTLAHCLLNSKTSADDLVLSWIEQS